MAHNGFLKIKGIKGNSQAQGHKNEIEITSWEQKFSYEKQSITAGIEKFKQMKIKNGGDNIASLKNLQASLPDFEKLKNYNDRDDKGNLKTNTTEYKKISQKVNQWQKRYKETIDNIDDDWKDNNADTVDMLDTFQETIDDFQESLKGSNHDPLSFKKFIDNASPKLLDACCQGTKISECTFYCHRSINVVSGKSSSLSAIEENDFIEVTLYEVYISKYNIDQDNSALAKETISLNYDRARFKFFEGNPQTGQRGSHKIIIWSWEKGEAKAS
jgi:type VI secretion system Hcp family effector